MNKTETKKSVRIIRNKKHVQKRGYTKETKKNRYKFNNTYKNIFYFINKHELCPSFV